MTHWEFPALHPILWGSEGGAGNGVTDPACPQDEAFIKISRGQGLRAFQWAATRGAGTVVAPPHTWLPQTSSQSHSSLTLSLSYFLRPVSSPEDPFPPSQASLR